MRSVGIIKFNNLAKKTRNRKTTMSEAEMMSILLLFQYGQFTNFKHFYIHYVQKHLQDCFPKTFSYSRFIQLQSRVAIPLMLFLKLRCKGKSRGINCFVHPNFAYRYKNSYLFRKMICYCL